MQVINQGHRDALIGALEQMADNARDENNFDTPHHDAVYEALKQGRSDWSPQQRDALLEAQEWVEYHGHTLGFVPDEARRHALIATLQDGSLVEHLKRNTAPLYLTAEHHEVVSEAYEQLNDLDW